MACKLCQLKKKKTTSRNFQGERRGRTFHKERTFWAKVPRHVWWGKAAPRPARVPLVQRGETVEEFIQCDASSSGCTLARTPCTWDDRTEEGETGKKVMPHVQANDRV